MRAAFSLGPLDGYKAADGRYDELLGDDGTVRPHWLRLVESFENLGTGRLLDRAVRTRRQLAQDGVTYNLGPDTDRNAPQRRAERVAAADTNGRPTANGGAERARRRVSGATATLDLPAGVNRHIPWPLDPVPLVVPDDEWATVRAGAAQRAELLNLILTDVYGERKLMRSGILPPELILGDPQFVRSLHKASLDGGPGPNAGGGSKQLVLMGLDFVRSADGSWRTFGHRTQVPSGAAYALEDRRVLSRVMPNEVEGADVQRLAPFLRLYRKALRSAAPPGVVDPVTVVLSSGTLSETAFEHTALAAQLGSALVQGSDLEVHDDGVYLQTVHGPTPVHVILRRLDAAYCDPLELDPSSTLGVPGLVEAVRSGLVTVVNGLGTPILENAGLTALLPELCRTLLGEDLLLSPAEAWWCGDPAARSHVLANLDELIVRPVSRARLGASVDATDLTGADRDELRAMIAARPEHFVGQERLVPGTAPCLTDDGLRPRPTVLRTFAVADDDGYYVMPGGLARSAATDDDPRTISNLTGALSKDIWVCGGSRELERGFWLSSDQRPVVARRGAPSARAAEDLFWLGRYAERAEATARLLRVIRDRRREFVTNQGGPGPVAVGVLLSALSRTTGTFPQPVENPETGTVDLASSDLTAAITTIVADDNNPGSLAHSLHRLLDDVDELRDQLSVDTKLVLADLDQRVRDLDHTADVPEETIDELLTDIIQGLLSLAGLVAESLIRDEIWYFIDAGRRLERAIHLVGLLAGSLTRERTAAAESLLIESVLTTAESIITYRRRYRSHAAVPSVLDLLLHDDGNPRSLRYQLDHLEADLHQLHEGQDIPVWRPRVSPAHPSVTDPAAVQGGTGQQQSQAGPGPGDGEDELSNTPMVAETITAVREISALLAGFEAELARNGLTMDEQGRRPTLAAFLDDAAGRLSFVSVLVSAAFFTRQQPSRSVVTPVDVSETDNTFGYDAGEGADADRSDDTDESGATGAGGEEK